MGAAMAERLRNVGIRLDVDNGPPDKSQPLEEKRAKVAASVALLEKCQA